MNVCMYMYHHANHCRPRLRSLRCGACLAGTGTAWKHCRPACAACVRRAGTAWKHCRPAGALCAACVRRAGTGTAWKHCRPLRCVCASGGHGHCMEALPSPALRVCVGRALHGSTAVPACAACVCVRIYQNQRRVGSPRVRRATRRVRMAKEWPRNGQGMAKTRACTAD